MMTILSGVGFLLLTLAVFSLFSLKFPKGSEAMSGMANAAVASFLIEAVHKYITGDLLGIAFLAEVGSTAGSLGGVAAGVMVPICMGANPVFAVVAGLACGGYGILPGFIAGYIVGLIAPYIEKYLPTGLDLIAGALIIAPVSRLIAFAVDPAVNSVLGVIGGTITAAAEQSPAGYGLPAGRYHEDDLHLSAELDGADRHAGPHRSADGYCGDCLLWRFLHQRHGLPQDALRQQEQHHCGYAGASDPGAHRHRAPNPDLCFQLLWRRPGRPCRGGLGIVNNAPGTASPIPGMIAPFGFNPAGKVVLALALAALGGALAGYVGGTVFSRLESRKKAPAAYADPLADDEEILDA